MHIGLLGGLGHLGIIGRSVVELEETGDLVQNILPGSCGVLPGLVGDVAEGAGSLNSGLIRLVLGIGLIIAAELAVVTAGSLILIRRSGLISGDQFQIFAALF